MIKKTNFLVAVLAGLTIAASFFSSCYYDNKEELYGTISCDTSSVSYSADILPILESECFLCHSSTAGGVLGGGNVLEGYDNLLDYISVNDAENSLFYSSIAWIPGTSFMPKGGEQLNDCDIAKVRSWINSGALNN